MNTEVTEYVWDPLVRLFHWSLVTAYAVAWATGDDWMTLHEFAGYVIGGLLLFRLSWGVIGTRHARFGDFVRPPREVIAYLMDVVRGRPRRYVGHNPAGGAMVVLLLVTLLLTVVTGVLALGGEEFRGPAAGLAIRMGDDGAEFFEEAHEVLANFTLLLVFAHVAGVILASFQHHENLVRAMFTGRKPRATNH